METRVLCAAAWGMMGLQPTAGVAPAALGCPCPTSRPGWRFLRPHNEKGLITENRNPSVWKPLDQ